MATVSRQGQPPTGPSGGGAPGDRPPVITWPRVFALGALALVVLIVAYVLFSGSSSARFHVILSNGSGLVRGDDVQVGGAPVGSVKAIELTPRYAARVTIEVQSSLLPLHKGTTAQVRVPSLGSVASRYISLTPGPNNMPVLPSGSTLPMSATKAPVDLDELFNTLNPATRKGLEEFINGTATQYQEVGKEINAATPYFSPALNATNHVFQELTREEPALTSLLVESAKALETLADHRAEIGSLVRNAGTALGAVGSEAHSFETGLKALPEALHEGNQAFNELPQTVTALRHLVNVSKPNTKTLALFFSRLRGLVTEATPVSAQLASAFSKPGPNNDLTNFAEGVPGLYKSLQTATPNNVKALNQSVPITNFFGPYAPDFVGLFRTFGQVAGYRDANGQYMRISPDFADFELEGEKLKPVTTAQSLEGLKTKQLRRCPGAATQPAEDGSSPFTDEGLLGCEPSEVP
jgi:phospholipid/cholesterol/gamma-HCH transport system substrate-binding protein